MTETPEEIVGYSKNKTIRVTWVDLGEGLCGDYTGEPDDVPLLRFDADRLNENGEYEPIEDGSYCTRLGVGTSPSFLKKAAEAIADDVENAGNRSVKRLLEGWSWIEVE